MSSDLKLKDHQINLSLVKAPRSRIYEFENYRLDAEHLMLYRDGEELSLTPKQVETLLALVEFSGEIVSKDVLMERLWGDTAVEEANLIQNVHFLRKALGLTAEGRPMIETLRRRGYRFNAELKPSLPSRPTFTPEISLVVPDGQTLRTGEATDVPRTSAEAYGFFDQIKYKLLLGLALTAILVGLAFGYFYANREEAPVAFEEQRRTRLTSSGKVKNAVIAPDGKFFVYSKEEVDLQQSLWVQHIGSGSNVQIMPPAYINYLSLNITPDGNSLYYADARGSLFRMAVMGGLPKKVLDGIDAWGFQNIAISPDGSQIGFVRADANGSIVYKSDADGANERQLAAIQSPDAIRQTLSWSPDGKTIACWLYSEGRQGILAVNVEDGSYSRVLQNDWPWVMNFTWLPDSRGLLVSGNPGTRRGIWQVPYPAGEPSEITGDNTNYYYLSASFDGRALLAVRGETTSEIWTSSSVGEGSTQLTAGFEKLDGTFFVTWLSDGRLFYDSRASGNYAIWTMEGDGRNARQLVDGVNFAAVSPNGRYLVYGAGAQGLRKRDLNDGTEKELTSSLDISPTFSPDGRWVWFQRLGDSLGLWKVSIEGGAPTRIVEGSIKSPTISPDGKTFAALKGGKVVVLTLGGEIIKTFDITSVTNLPSGVQPLRWTSKGDGIYYIAVNNQVSNIWQQPIDGSPPVQVTNFESGLIFNFTFSPDGKRLAIARGSLDSDVFLIENSALSD